MKNFMAIIIIAVSMCLLSLITFGCAEQESDTTSTTVDPLTLKGTDILRSLGVQEVATPPVLETVSTQGTKIKQSDEWHPLKKDVTTFSPKSELMMFGIKTSSSNYNTMFQDSSESYVSSIPLVGDQAWLADYAKTTCEADVDGDGIKEVVLLYAPTNGSVLKMRIYKGGAFSGETDISNIPLPSGDDLKEVDTFVVTGLKDIPNARYVYNRLNSCSVDLIGDGKESVIVSVKNIAYIININTGSNTASIIDSKTYIEDITDIASGDCDGDGEDEFVIALKNSGFAFCDSSFSKSLLGMDVVLVSSNQLAGEVCFGDFDGDKMDEIAVATIENNKNVIHIYNFSSGSLTKVNTLENFGLPIQQQIYRAFPRAIDINGDGRDELYFTNWIIDRPATSNTIFLEMHDTNNYFGGISSLKIADVDGDGKEDVVYHGVTAGTKNHCIFAYGYNSSNSWVEKKRYFEEDNGDVPADYVIKNNVSIVTGNFDNDSIRVKFSKHELLFTHPMILAVLAAPPYWADIASSDSENYNFEEWETSFGTSETSGTSDESSVGFSVGLKVEFEQEVSFFGIKGAQFKMSAAFSTELDWTVENSFSITKSKTYIGYGAKNRIVFTAIPVDQYYYEVLYSPDSAAIGTIMNISLPRDYSIYSVEQDFYNANNGALADIGEDIFTHTLGSPFTYPTVSQKNNLISTGAIGYQSEKMTPAQGAGVTELSIEVESGKSFSQSFESSVELEVGGGVGGVSILGTLGFHGGMSTTTSTATGTTFSGTVGNLPAVYFNNPNYSYSQGLFVYPRVSSAGNIFWVINYWVE